MFWTLFVVFAATGLSAGSLPGPTVLLLATTRLALAFLDNTSSRRGHSRQPRRPACVSQTILVGGSTDGVFNGLVLTFAALAFAFDLGEETASDAMDVEGDRVRSGRSLGARRGQAFALALAGVVIAPFIAGWPGRFYLLSAVAADPVMTFLTACLVRSPTTAGGRVLVRRPYPAWSAIVVVFVAASLL